MNIGSEFDELMMVPLKEALGIDEFAKLKSKYRSWNGLKMFFNEKLEMLKSMFEEKIERSPVETLKSDVAKNIHTAIGRQLNYMAFYREGCEVSEETKQKI